MGHNGHPSLIKWHTTIIQLSSRRRYKKGDDGIYHLAVVDIPFFMRWQLTTLVFQSLLLLAAASDKYCSGEYSHGGDHCKKFEFDSTTDEEKCGSSSGSKHGDNSVNGIKLSNCTTYVF